MKLITPLAVIALLLSSLYFGVAGVAAVSGITCDAETPTLCTISTTKNLAIAAGGSLTVTVDKALLITSTGSINVLVPDTGLVRTLNLNVAGDLTIEPGGKITGNAPASNRIGATLNITAIGKISLQSNGTGAMITADQTGGSCSGNGHAGTINLTSTHTPVDASDVSIAVGENALISTNGTICPAGNITIAAPNGRITIDGTVESAVDTGSTGNGRAEDGGPITIEAGCDLLVTGKVSSRGRDNGADRVHLSGGCSVVVTGLVESIGAGHITNGKNVCHGPERPDKPTSANMCVEIWSGGTIDINGGAEVRADATLGGGQQGSFWVDVFAVGDITITGGTGNFAVHSNTVMGSDAAGVVTVKSRDGGVTATGNAVQADAVQAGSNGGSITVESTGDALLDGAVVQALGDTNPTGGLGVGGTISVKSFQGALSWATGKGDARPAGSITLSACTALTPGATFTPAAGTTQPNACAGAPEFEDYVVFPTCQCSDDPDFGFCNKAPVRSVLDPVTGRFPGNLGPDMLVRFDLGELVQTGLDTVTDSNGDGYIILAVAKDDTAQLGGHSTESIVINRAYEQRFALIGCSVTLHDAALGDGEPTAKVAGTASSPAGSPENIFVMDVHAADSDAAGWLIEGDGRYFRNVYAIDNALGFVFAGNGNTMHNGKAEDNSGNGVSIIGNRNFVDSADSMGNGGDGVNVAGNLNTIKKMDIGDRGKGNGGDGIHLVGYGNLLQENDAYANAGDGLDVAGGTAASPNRLLKNKAGDRGKGNGGNGFVLGATDGGNGNSAPIELEENTAKSNSLNGLLVYGAGHQLKKNVSGGKVGSDYVNGLCQFNVAAGNFNSTGNKSFDILIPGSNGTAFPIGCK